jgi:hypothetical protein
VSIVERSRAVECKAADSIVEQHAVEWKASHSLVEKSRAVDWEAADSTVETALAHVEQKADGPASLRYPQHPPPLLHQHQSSTLESPGV